LLEFRCWKCDSRVEFYTPRDAKKMTLTCPICGSEMKRMGKMFKFFSEADSFFPLVVAVPLLVLGESEPVICLGLGLAAASVAVLLFQVAVGLVYFMARSRRREIDRSGN
jgi:DNA-directed RNA polymerase subunit RPC12/RpoP